MEKKVIENLDQFLMLFLMREKLCIERKLKLEFEKKFDKSG